MATKRDCIRVAVNMGLTEDDAVLLVDDIAAQWKKLTVTGQTDAPRKALARRIREQAERARRRALAQRRQAALNSIALDRIQTFVDTVKAEGGDVVDALEALLVGSRKHFSGSGESASRLGSSLKALWGGSMANELDRAGVLPLLQRDRNFSDVVMREMIEPESTGDGTARRTADIFSRYLEHMRQQLNEYGADIDRLEGYAPQSHDSLKLRRAGEEEWVNYMAQRLDWERSFPDLPQENRRSALAEAYQNIITGLRREAEKPEAAGRSSAFTPPRTVAGNLGREWVLHFKDAASAVEYNRRFGTGNIMQGMVDRLETYARKLALMRTFGPNPEAMIRSVLDNEAAILRQAHGNPERILKAWQHDGRGKLGTYYRALAGETGTPENLTAARIAAAIRGLTSMAQLSGAFLSSFADIGIKASAVRHAREGWLESWGVGISMRFKRFQNAEKRELGRQLDVYTRGLLGALYSKFDVTDALSGRMTRWMNAFSKMSGLTGWTEAHRAAYALHLSSRLAHYAAGDAEDLNKDLAVVLRRNGLMDRIDLIHKMADDLEGERYVIPENAWRLTDADLEEHLPEHLREENRPVGVNPAVDLKALVPVVTIEPSFPRGIPLYEAHNTLMREVRIRVPAAFSGENALRHPFFGERPITLSETDFKEHLQKETKGAAKSWLQLEAVNVLPELMRNAQWVASYGEYKPDEHRRSEQVHRFIAALQIGGKEYAVTLTIKEFSEGKLALDMPEVLKLYHHNEEKEPSTGISNLSRRRGEDRLTAGIALSSLHPTADDNANLRTPRGEEPESDRREGNGQSNGVAYTIQQLIFNIRNDQGAPYGIHGEDQAQWEAARAVERNRIRENLARDVIGYFADETGYALLEPDAPMLAAMYSSGRPGTIGGEILRFAWQLKAFPVTFHQRIVRESRRQEASADQRGRISGDIPGFIHCFAVATALGSVNIAARDASKGREPRTIQENSLEVILAALVRGGGLGLLGDFFLGMADRFGTPPLANVTGPTSQPRASAGLLTGRLARGEFRDGGETAVRAVMDTLPFVNLWYTLMALEYLVTYHVQDQMSPGILQRSKENMRQKFRRKYLSINTGAPIPTRPHRAGPRPVAGLGQNLDAWPYTEQQE